MALGGAEYRLDPSAISAVRYRAEYGDSIVNHLAACRSRKEWERRLLRLCYTMIPPPERPPLLEFSRQARRDGHFLDKARAAQAALLAPDPRRRSAGGEPTAASFDEYQVLALLSAAGVGVELVYELPVMHLLGVVGRAFDLRNPDKKTYRPMSGREMAQLYPGRRMKHGGAGPE